MRSSDNGVVINLSFFDIGQLVFVQSSMQGASRSMMQPAMGIFAYIATEAA